MRFSLVLLGAFASLVACQKLPIPASKGKTAFSAPKQISGVFDGGMKTYGRGVKCSGGEGGEKDAVFILAPGATLKNAIIGADQKEGVHCKGPCTIENVWWEKVCEDALSIKGDGSATVRGGGAQGAEDKVVQHNGFGTVTITNFIVINFGKLYRSCGNCKGNGKARKVVISNVQAYKGKNVAGINTNFGDRATISASCATGVKTICQEFTGTTPGKEPKSTKPCAPQSLPACPGSPKSSGPRRNVRFRFRSRSLDFQDWTNKWLTRLGWRKEPAEAS